MKLGPSLSLGWKRLAALVFPTRIYVSNSASNGYGAGNDTTGNGTKATPYATIAKAVSVASAGNQIIINGGTYAETSGSGWLASSTALIFIGDGTVTLRNDNTKNYTAQAWANLEFHNFDFDMQNADNRHGIRVETAHVKLFNCRFINQKANVACLYMNQSSSAVTAYGCSLSNCAGDVVTYFATNTTGWMRSFGCDWSGAATGWLVQTYSTYVGKEFTMSRWNSRRSTVTGFGQGVRVNDGNNGAVHISYTDFALDGAGVAVYHKGKTSRTTSLDVHHNTFTGATSNSTNYYLNFIGQVDSARVHDNTSSGTYGLFGSSHESSADIQVYSNDITVSVAEAVAINYGTTGIQVTRNTVRTSQTSGRSLLCGTDGLTTDVTNAFHASNTINFRSSSSNQSISQAITRPAMSTTNPSSSLASLRLKLKKVGSPVGTFVIKVYADNAGAPTGNALATSEAINMATIPATATDYEVWFASHETLAYSTKFHFRLEATGHTINGTDYIQLIAESSTYAGGKIATYDGASWTVTSSSCGFTLCMGSYAMVDPVLSWNTVLCTPASLSDYHGPMCGAVSGFVMEGNLVYNAAIGMIAKLVQGNSTTKMLNCLVYGGAYSRYQAFRDKGSSSVQIINCTGIMEGGNEVVCADADNYGRQSQNCTVKGGLFYRSSSGVGTVYTLGAGNVGTSLDYNCAYAGSNTTLGTTDGANSVTLNPQFGALPPTDASGFTPGNSAVKAKFNYLADTDFYGVSRIPLSSYGAIQ